MGEDTATLHKFFIENLGKMRKNLKMLIKIQGIVEFQLGLCYNNTVYLSLDSDNWENWDEARK